MSGLRVPRSVLFCWAFAACLAAGGCGDNDGVTPVPTAATTATQWEPFEAVLERTVAEANPFDPATVEIDADFRSPAGDVLVVPAFVGRDYTRSLVGGFEKLAAAGELQWRVRFSPPAPGRWHWRWRVRTPLGTTETEWEALIVAPAAPGVHGLVRRSARDPRYLEHDDGTPFFAVGENLCWYDGRGTFAYDVWIERLAAQGVNYIRLWMPSWAFGLEWITRAVDGSVANSSLGNYTTRLDRAWQLDYVVDLARRHGIQIMLSIQNHGAFSLSNNSEWADCPYNAANGGPLARPREFFTDPEARRLFRQRLRYIVARWGYATNVMTWELWNEVDLADQPEGLALIDWHREMGRELRALDPYDRLVSTSLAWGDGVSLGALVKALWELEEIDYTQGHYYSFGIAVNFTEVLPRQARKLARYGKPVLIAEAGVDFRGPAETIAADPGGDGFHDILWSGVMGGTFGTGMSWWWDNVVDPRDQYFHFGPVAAFVRGVDFAGQEFAVTTADTTAPDGRPLRVFALRGASVTLAWVKNMRHQWSAPDASVVTGATAVFDGLADGTWRATWFDTWGGGTTEGIGLVPAGGQLRLAVPEFARDIAVRLERAEG